MPDSAENKAVERSEKLFRRLLALYPEAHRQEYGVAMTQLFRDQCRDVWLEARHWGLAKLWLRVLPDLLHSSVLEHLENCRRRRSMFNVLRSRSAPLLSFLTAFTVVFALVFGASVPVTFILPESYCSTARVLVRQARNNASPGTEGPGANSDPYLMQTEFEIIRSEAVLGQAAGQLDLNAQWGKKYAGGAPLKTSKSLDLLKRRLDLLPIRNTGTIQIRAFSDNSNEAAALANAIAQAYVGYHEAEAARETDANVKAALPRVFIIDSARPGLRPVRPNKPLNILLGAVLGIFLGSVAGAGSAGITFLRRRSKGPGNSLKASVAGSSC
jgi:uncharacterized protein involved in exopolysaccharide biosynthesis